MKTFKVIDPKGVHLDGTHHAAGQTFTSSKPLGAHVLAFLHFKQVEDVTPPEEKPAEDPAKEPEAKAKGGK